VAEGIMEEGESCTQQHHADAPRDRALRAPAVHPRRRYIKDGEVIMIVDDTPAYHAGTSLVWSAPGCEAKEGVDIQNENQTLASITFLLPSVREAGGMTGTPRYRSV
jgi:preprotein translocase subunit SecA